jgi:transposase InsO family protein
VSDKFEFIDGLKYAYPIARMCAWLSVSRSGFYDWRCRPMSATTERRESIKEVIREIFESSDQTYGYRRVHAALARQGRPAGPELVRAPPPHRPSAETPCSRQRSRRCAGSASAHGESARSPPQRWFCSTTSMTGQHDQPATGKGAVTPAWRRVVQWLSVT